MFHERLAHDAAFVAATSIMERLQQFFPPGENTTAFVEIYERISAAIEAYSLYTQRQQDRLAPGRN